MKSYLKYNWPSMIWAAFILVICLMPGRHIPKVGIPHIDKLVHFSIYTIFAMLTYAGWRMQKGIPTLHRNTLIKVILTLAAYGLCVEIMQEAFTADRHFELLDEAANTSGAIVGAWVCSWFVRV